MSRPVAHGELALAVRRHARRRGGVVAWVAAAATLAALSGCSASVSVGGDLNTGKLESEIVKGIKDQTGLVVTVACPDGVKMSKGNTFECTATAANGDTAPVRVVQKDGDGNVSWSLGSGTSTTPTTGTTTN